MADHLVLYVDRLISPTLEPVNEVNVTMTPTQILGKQNLLSSYQVGSSKKIDEEGGEFVECRICQEEDVDKSMEIPCACTGSMKYAHRKCVQRWCNEKGDITCEICQQIYKLVIQLLHRLILMAFLLISAMAAAERHFLAAEYDEYAAANASGAGCCRSAALIFMALLLLRHALAINQCWRRRGCLNILHSFPFESCRLPSAMLHHGTGNRIFYSVGDRDRRRQQRQLKWLSFASRTGSRNEIWQQPQRQSASGSSHGH